MGHVAEHNANHLKIFKACQKCFKAHMNLLLPYISTCISSTHLFPFLSHFPPFPCLFSILHFSLSLTSTFTSTSSSFSHSKLILLFLPSLSSKGQTQCKVTSLRALTCMLNIQQDTNYLVERQALASNTPLQVPGGDKEGALALFPSQ